MRHGTETYEGEAEELEAQRAEEATAEPPERRAAEELRGRDDDTGYDASVDEETQI